MVKSHIQMPKVLLKRFHNAENRFFYFDVVKRVVGNNGNARSINTELGYYSQEMEDYLRDNIETPFGTLLKHIDENGIGEETFSICEIMPLVIKVFTYSLIARGPDFNHRMNEEPDFWQDLPPQFQHDYIAKRGIELQAESNVFSDYIATFMINRTNVPFVLSMDGIYSFVLNGHTVVNLPISPYVAISLIHESYEGRVLNEDGSINMFEIHEGKTIEFMNERAFSTQLKRKWGYVVCPERGELDRLKELCCARVG